MNLTIIITLISYYLITGFIAFGRCLKPKFTIIERIISFIFGFILIPISIGVIIGNIIDKNNTMKKTITILLTIIICTSCAGNTDKKQNKDDEKYVIREEIENIIFDFNYMDTFEYSDFDNLYILHYQDPDIFDIENLYEEDYHKNYVSIQVDEETLQYLLNDYNDFLSYKEANNYEEKNKINDKYTIIKRDKLYNNGKRIIVFNLELDTCNTY